MSPRPKRKRHILRPPFVKGYAPLYVDLENRDHVTMLFEEYEAIRLADYLSLSHEEAAKSMRVSRPTFTRIYEQARKKVSRFLVENSVLEFVGGDVVLDEQWTHCSKCENFSELSSNYMNSQLLDCPYNEFDMVNTEIFNKEPIAAIPCKTNNIESEIDRKFSRCEWFALIKMDTGKCHFERNPFSKVKSCPAGGVLRFLKSWNVSEVYIQEIGKHSIELLKNSEIKVISISKGEWLLKALIEFYSDRTSKL
ncbi:MAG: DUF134 domain-containing protein [Hyphomicrobiales bacterium]